MRDLLISDIATKLFGYWDIVSINSEDEDCFHLVLERETFMNKDENLSNLKERLGKCYGRNWSITEVTQDHDRYAITISEATK